jgi:preprotein translocase subunit SecE
MSTWTWVWIILGVIVAGYLVYTGQLLRLSNYVQETREELKKCTWPTWAELKGSTVVVIISVALLGLFTVVVDVFFAAGFRWVVSIIT